ncbi:MAG TPA: PTS sugar transporter subunit IIA [Planctomycetota bacterium]|nr:PTS sugar transporter subunit IIA [Planctomycetota bacterium]
MDLRQLFQPSDLILGFAPQDKWDAIRLLVSHLVSSGRFAQPIGEKIHEQVISRERSMSTGMERGIAIPHAAVDEVSKVTACMGIVQRPGGLAFESIDGQPARLVVLLVIPRAHKLLHIRTLADVARVLGNDQVRERLVAAQEPQQAWEALGNVDR